VGAEQTADRVAESGLIAGPEVAVDIEGDLGGLVAERRPHLLDAATRVDQGAAEEVAQVVERDRLGQPGASTSRTQLVAELRRVERHAVTMEEHTVGAEAVCWMCAARWSSTH
jgi:hypothetical protein